ncbi:MAG TPA: TIM barrel protein [Candidatus Paceibacterota bacterium]|nr:TIM barrel protein [Verrucomicrobiota bacterium]HSA10841.1 TIM barrel protein [Candidatus Paceibacterota bacterium]
MAKQQYQFCFGPWNISEGQDPYGPPTRPAQTFDWKLKQLKKLGFDAMMFHDDDAVPDIDGKSDAQLRKESKELKTKLADAGVAAEMVAPRLWFSPKTIDGAYTNNDPKCRQYAIERSLRCIDVANYLGTDLIVLWLAREGTYLREAKNGRRSVDLLVQALDKMLAHDRRIRISIEPKPNEPMDHAYVPTIGHALAIAQLTRDPKRVGCLIESAHAILAGLDPADEIDFAMAFGKLWSLHLNDQNGLKFDQDKPFASSNLRVAFNQVRALERNGYGKNGEYVCFDVHPFRSTKVEHWLAHLSNSRRTFMKLVRKARTFDEKAARQLVADRNYAALDQMVLEHLMGE